MLVPLLFLVVGADVPVGEIMARVGANQDRLVELRKRYIYMEKAHVQTRHTNGKLARDETTEYEVFPGPKGLQKKLTAAEGRYWHKGSYVEFKGKTIPDNNSLDEGLISSFREGDDMTNDLPLTTKSQKEYRFELLGEQVVDGRKAWRIGFGPANRNDISWAGEALIDEQEFQPFRIYTKLSRRIPFAIRALLGTNLPGIGYNVTYQRLDKDVWFPASYGAEFTLHVLFFLNREINMSKESRDFHRAPLERYFTGP
jgi:hypothetical protein